MSVMKTENILGLARQFIESRVLLTAAELDIFTILARKPLSAKDIADKLKATLRGTTILLNALVALGLLEKKDGLFLCPESLIPTLDKNSPQSVVPMLIHSASMWRRWSDLTNIVLNGVDSNTSVAFDGSKDQAPFIAAMHAIGMRLAGKIIEAIKPGEARKLLDVGGASGTYTQAFLEASPNMHATLFDLAAVIKIAHRRLTTEGLIDRVTLVAGNFYQDELPKGHDLALLSAIIHQNSPEQNVMLYSKVFRALESGGRLIIRDHIMKPDHTEPTSGALFAVNMLVGTVGGSTYTFEEIRDTLTKAGFVKTRLIQTGNMMDGLIESFKP